MNIKYIHRLETIDSMIRTKSSGPPQQFARKIGLSRSKLFLYLDLLKQLGAPIKYDKDRCCYYYEYMGEFSFRYHKPYFEHPL